MYVKRRVIIGVVAIGLLTRVPGAAPTAQAASVAADTISQIGTLANFYYKAGDNGLSKQVGAFADPANRLLFELDGNNSACPNLVALDIDSYRVRAADKAVAGTSSCQVSFHRAGLDPQPTLAVDPIDHVLIVPQNSGSIAFVSEGTLAPILQFTVPPVSPNVLPPTPEGVTWYGVGDQLLVLSDYQGEPPGVQVTSLSIAQTLKTGQPAVLWADNLSECNKGLTPTFATAPAYHATGEATVYVPCRFNSVFERDGVVKLYLSPANCMATATECPSGRIDTAVAPGVMNDVYFDPGSDRLFMPTQTNGSQVTVYDGERNVFGVKVSIGPDADTNAFGVDPTTGRFYAVGPSSGMTAIDGRRTPLQPGAVFRQYANAEFPNTFPVLPADAAYPYPRLLVNHDVGYDPQGTQASEQPDYLVYADTRSLLSDPPAGAIDANTAQGPIPSGATTSLTYGGDARGYGFHVDAVGGAEAVAADTFEPVSLGLPFYRGARDVLGAEVADMSITSQFTQGDASALAAADSSTAYDYATCTDARQTTNCAPPPQSVNGQPVPQPPAFPDSVASAIPRTAQPWPYGDATCDYPGPVADRDGFAKGMLYASPQQKDPQQAPVVDDTHSHAEVHCGGPYTAGALYQAPVVPSSSPTITVGTATTTTSVTPASPSAPVTATVTAESDGIDIKIDANDSITIGQVVQRATAEAGGRPGTTRTTRLVTLSDVVVTKDGDSTIVCQQVCPGQSSAVLDQLENAFPGAFSIRFPSADDRYSHDCASPASDGTVTCNGSSGGYIAAVQSPQVQQYGDAQFNAMSPEEAAFLPAVRIVLYNPNDGNPSISRLVVDLAGVDADAELGIDVLPSFSFDANSTQAMVAAATAAGLPVSSIEELTRPGGSAGNPGGDSGGLPLGGASLAERALVGLTWLLRSPRDALQMLAFLGLLGAPLVVARRRWTWDQGEVDS